MRQSGWRVSGKRKPDLVDAGSAEVDGPASMRKRWLEELAAKCKSFGPKSFDASTNDGGSLTMSYPLIMIEVRGGAVW